MNVEKSSKIHKKIQKMRMKIEDPNPEDEIDQETEKLQKQTSKSKELYSEVSNQSNNKIPMMCGIDLVDFWCLADLFWLSKQFGN